MCLCIFPNAILLKVWKEGWFWPRGDFIILWPLQYIPNYSIRTTLVYARLSIGVQKVTGNEIKIFWSVTSKSMWLRLYRTLVSKILKRMMRLNNTNEITGRKPADVWSRKIIFSVRPTKSGNFKSERATQRQKTLTFGSNGEDLGPDEHRSSENHNVTLQKKCNIMQRMTLVEGNKDQSPLHVKLPSLRTFRVDK